MKGSYSKLPKGFFMGKPHLTAPLLYIFLAGCSSGDTCPKSLGMSKLAVLFYDQNSASLSTVRFNWSAGQASALYSDDYYSRVSLSHDTSAEVASLLREVKYIPVGQIQVVFNPLKDYTAKYKDVSYTLVFPDPRMLQLCTHPGQDDQYYLSITHYFNADGTFRDTAFKESIYLGAI
jgi:hypothetical protein